jgi:hypothetical protein
MTRSLLAAGVAALSLSLVACGGDDPESGGPAAEAAASPESAPDPAAADFLDAVEYTREQAIADLRKYGDDATLIGYAQSSCERLDGGAPLADVIGVVRDDTAANPRDAGLIVGIAVATMCPEHQ